MCKAWQTAAKSTCQPHTAHAHAASKPGDQLKSTHHGQIDSLICQALHMCQLDLCSKFSTSKLFTLFPEDTPYIIAEYLKNLRLIKLAVELARC